MEESMRHVQGRQYAGKDNIHPFSDMGRHAKLCEETHPG
jgi:hypothetical protein